MPQWNPSSIFARLQKTRLTAAFLGVASLAFFFGECTDYVRPYEAGIKQSRYGGGIEQHIYAGGRWYFTGPGVTIHRFPKSVQALEMTDDAAEAALSPDARRAPRIEIDTSDGSKVKVDVTVLYRIVDPYAVFTKIGPKRLFEDAALIPKAVLALKKNLGKLLAEEFYSDSRRVERALAARDEMNTLLKEVGIEVDHVLVRQYYYEHGYQEQIENRKVQDQLVFTNKSLGEASKEDAARRKIESEGKAATEVEKQRGEAEVTKIRADANLYKQKKQSEGDMLVKIAEAKGTQLVNQAYGSAGSENLVAAQMAKVLEGIDTIIVSDEKTGINPLNLEQMTRMIGGK